MASADAWVAASAVVWAKISAMVDLAIRPTLAAVKLKTV